MITDIYCLIWPMDWLVSKNIKYYRLACSAGIFCAHKCIHVFSYQATILYLLTVEDWGEEILAEGVGVKWKKRATPTPPLHQPSTVQASSYNPRWWHRSDLSSVPLQNDDCTAGQLSINRLGLQWSILIDMSWYTGQIYRQEYGKLPKLTKHLQIR